MAQAKSIKSGKSAGKEAPSPEAIINRFQEMRTQQRNIANKIAELEQDRNEHKWVWLIIVHNYRGLSYASSVWSLIR